MDLSGVVAACLCALCAFVVTTPSFPTPMNASKQIEFEPELKLGIRNMWYPICQSGHVKERPLGLHRLGHDIVVWRDPHGKIRVHDDRCLHRGAKLSVGMVVDGVLRCAYQSFEAHERAGLVWAYFPEDRSVPVPPLVIPEELEDPEYSGFICEAEWGANWILIMENLADPMHGPFLHGQSLTLSRGALEDDMRTTRSPDGFLVEREGQRGVNFDWSEFYCRDSIWVRLDIPLPFGPKGILRILCFATPINEDRSLVYFLRYRKLSGFKRAYWRFLYRTFWVNQHQKVIEQDRVILESLRGAQSRAAEHLANSDRGVTELRKFLREKVAWRSQR